MQLKQPHLTHTMNAIDTNTYTHGFNFKLHTPVTKDGMVTLCRSLEKTFGEGNVFQPEGISDGFIHWVQWPGKDADTKAYKCMRCWRYKGSNHWPWVPVTAMTTWVGDEQIALEMGMYGTFLKSFYAAPAWTRAELGLFKECFEKEGFEVMKIPSLKRKRAVFE